MIEGDAEHARHATTGKETTTKIQRWKLRETETTKVNETVLQGVQNVRHEHLRKTRKAKPLIAKRY